MLKPLRLLNLLLGLVAALLGVALTKTWVSPVAPMIPSSGATKPSQEGEALAYNPTARPPLAQFEVLLEKNPFKQPPPRPAGPGAAGPPPIPLPTLVGTVLVDHERKAILSDRGKANIYAVGQAVAGGTIVEIKEDRIIYKRGDATQEIMLKAAITPAATTMPLPPAPAAGPSGGQTSQTTAPVPPQVEGSPTTGATVDREELQRRRQAQIEQRRRMLEQRRATQ